MTHTAPATTPHALAVKWIEASGTRDRALLLAALADAASFVFSTMDCPQCRHAAGQRFAEEILTTALDRADDVASAFGADRLCHMHRERMQ